MTTIGFDTLSASKRLRDAGMDQPVAEAIVELVQQTTMLPDISDLATKSELAATRADLQTTKAELKADLKNEIALVRADMALMESRLRVDLSEKIRLQGWAILGGVAVLMTISTALIKLTP
ncbi:hypothetical protein EIB18_13090 [Caulobacter vibrioides]|uniref:hypothetical protein n=1 Tax=Caulobacter vibrioides TaxID=155892 RepID=UPI000BB4FC1C|nr:hypothetical protein [Caulobacter vibrioides]ATC25457.1 hypothetical protein CA608_13425 [Caulobacter vibrioides]AZH13551.1 hypothetical protein EIB18_13090 [Caulobacter vibrioides]PLR14417.1 hypothetical protein CVUC_04380 [Caulobacter vibrioides]